MENNASWTPPHWPGFVSTGQSTQANVEKDPLAPSKSSSESHETYRELPLKLFRNFSNKHGLVFDPHGSLVADVFAKSKIVQRTRRRPQVGRKRRGTVSCVALKGSPQKAIGS